MPKDCRLIRRNQLSMVFEMKPNAKKILVAEDNMRDLLETAEEVALYDMRKRMLQTPLFQIPPPAE